MLKEIRFVTRKFEKKRHAVVAGDGDLTHMKEFCNRLSGTVFYRKRQNYHNRNANPFKEIKTLYVFYFNNSQDVTWFKLAFSQFITQWEWN